MEKKEKKVKNKKINAITEFDMRKKYKEKEKYEQELMDSKKYFGKIKILKVRPLKNIISHLFHEHRTLPKKSKNSSMLFFPKRKLHFYLSKPVYSDNRKNFLTLKSINYNNLFYKDNELNSNIIRKKKKINKLPKNNGLETVIINTGINSGKFSILNKQKNKTGFDKHVIISKSCADLGAETKYTSDIRNIKTCIAEEQKNQNNYFNKSNKYNERHSVLSTLEYSTIKRDKPKISKKYQYSRENILKHFSDNTRHSFKNMDKEYFKLKKKYNFVNNTNLMKIDNYDELKKKTKQFNKISLNILLKESKKLFSRARRIVEGSKFSQKFRDPLNNSFEQELKEERKIKDKNIIKLNILSGVNIIKDIDKEIEKRKIVKKVIKGKPFLSKIKRIIIRKMVYLKHIQITLEEILHNYKISKTAFIYPQTEYLIMSIRNKNFETCCDILDKYKYIVLDHDYFNLTPLHWAAKLNYFQIIPKLIAYGAPVNAQNLWGNTPLHFSANKNYFETSIFLLLYLASPFIKNKHNKAPFDCNKYVQINIISKKIKDIHCKNIIGRQKFFYENVQKEFCDFIIDEFSNILNPIALDLIKDLKSNYL